ncbi:hypothetical protein YDYSY3_26490 [Paenibacillus chitinolyticus]|uniref:methyl-accepting chemotaxis protein n=1 Tax=Paenibacillus chitinolyticus TaxID=79263 RepID=UPI0026E49F47|nr:methyl-accepting chemotaxis protein [Paenibacillus chitinolyticus]GKS11649.1 hypothetical protein YDYSY3_26490 [Paenibacillus chitinolyticus]
MKFKQKLALSFAAVLLLTFVVGAIGLYQLTSVNKVYQSLINDRVEKILIIKDLGTTAAEETKNVRGYLLTGNEEHFKSYEQGRQTFKADLSKLQANIHQDKSKELAARLSSLEEQYAGVVAEIAAYKKVEDIRNYTRLVEEKCVPMARQLADTAAELEEFQQSQLNQSVQETSQKVSDIKTLLWATVLVALVAGVVLTYLITRMIARPVTLVAQAAKRIAEGDLTGDDVRLRQKDEIGQLAGAFNEMKANLRTLLAKINRNAVEVAAASKELSDGSEQAVTGAQQVAESMQDISGTADRQVNQLRENKQAIEESAQSIQRIAESASITVESSEQAALQAEEGRKLLGETVVQMQQIRTTIEHSAEVIHDLGEQSRNIEKITAFIQDIARQTNLLSLNASIEAARAGEHGKGFAVVAGEVKKLAEQTGEASEQIAKGIQRMVQTVAQSVTAMNRGSAEVEAGTRVMNRTGEAFNGIYQAIGAVTGQVQEVSAATEELSAAMEQLLKAEEQLAGLSGDISGHSQSVAAVCEEQLASMEEISASSDALSHMAKELQDEIQKFKFEGDEPGAASQPNVHYRGHGELAASAS